MQVLCKITREGEDGGEMGELDYDRQPKTRVKSSGDAVSADGRLTAGRGKIRIKCSSRKRASKRESPREKKTGWGLGV